MSIEVDAAYQRQPERVDIYDPNAYRLSEHAPSRRQVFVDVADGFRQYVAKQAQQGSKIAGELKDTIDGLGEDYIANIVGYYAEVDWLDESPVDSVKSLFGVMESLNDMLNRPPVDASLLEDRYRLEEDDTGLDLSTRWLFANPCLNARHGYMWERFIIEDLTGRYVSRKEQVAPDEVLAMVRFAEELGADADMRIELGEDTRAVGVAQLVRILVRELERCESTDARFDYSKRLAAAQGMASCQGDTEAILEVLGQFVEPVDIDSASLSGALLKPVRLYDSTGTLLYEQWQRYDSLWFKPLVDAVDAAEDTGFPSGPRVVQSYEQGSRRRIVPNLDCSYVRPDGSKAYWGDLRQEDLRTVNGTYYCLSQADSFHDVPEWARVLDDSMLHPDYVRAVALGVIVDHTFVDNDARRRGVVYCRPVV